MNYYALGRLAWNTSLSTATVHAEFVARTFGAKLPAAAKESILSILAASETAADDLSIYRGYRGVWYKFCGGDHCTGAGLRSTPVNNQVISASGAGMPPALAVNLLEQFSPGLRAVYSNYSDPRSEKSLLEWGVFPLNWTLTNGRTLLDDMRERPSNGLRTAIKMRDLWRGLQAAVQAAVGERFWTTTAAELEEFVIIAREMVAHLHAALALLQPPTGADGTIKSDDTLAVENERKPPINIKKWGPLYAPCNTTIAKLLPTFCDPTQPVVSRARELVAALTLAEKVVVFSNGKPPQPGQAAHRGREWHGAHNYMSFATMLRGNITTMEWNVWGDFRCPSARA